MIMINVSLFSKQVNIHKIHHFPFQLDTKNVHFFTLFLRYSTPFSIFGLRANTCDDLLCRFRFIETSEMTLSKKLKKDPVMVDLLFSVFSFQQQTEYFNPEPPIRTNKTLEEIIRKMPSMSVLANCDDDYELVRKIDREAFYVLR